MMLEDLQRRNYAENTIRSYIRIVKDFSRRFQRSPERLGPKHIREYQSELFTKRKYRATTVTGYLAALRFFYTKTLKRAGSIAETPYPKRAFSLPTILSQEEVAQLIDAASPPVHRTLLMTLYATGLRRAELARLKVTDIDSRRMVVHVPGAKGRQDRDVMLSPKLLGAAAHRHTVTRSQAACRVPRASELRSRRPFGVRALIELGFAAAFQAKSARSQKK